MSFQQELDDAQHTLEMEEALAFISNIALTTADEGSAFSSHVSTASTGCDEPSTDLALYECAGIDWHVTTLRQSSEPIQLQSLQPPTEDPTLKPESKKKPEKKKAASESSGAILKLREQVEELQAQYPELRQTTRVVSISETVAMQQGRQDGTSQLCTHASRDEYSNLRATTTTNACSGWLELAMKQYKQRQQSEALNRKLRDAVANQYKVTTALQALLQKQVSPQDLKSLLEAPRPSPAAASLYCKLVNLRDLILAALYRSVESQFHETDRVCHGINAGDDTRSAFTTSRSKQDAERGPSIELTMNVPISSNVQLIGRLIWGHVMGKKNSGEMRTPSELQYIMQDIRSHSHCSRIFHENRMQMTMPSRVEELQVDGVIVFHKVEEAHRIVMTIASAYTVNGSRLVFRKNGWIVVSKASSNNSSSSSGRDAHQPVVFQTFLRIHSEKEDSRSPTGSSPFSRETVVSDEKTAYVQEFVMTTLGDHMRQHMDELQKALLSEVESIALNMVELKCPQVELTR